MSIIAAEKAHSRTWAVVFSAALAAFLVWTPAVARADAAEESADTDSADTVTLADDTVAPQETRVGQPVVKRANAPVAAPTTGRPASSGAAWLLAGLAGALVPLVLFALPLIWLVWIPGVGPLALLGASVWAGLMGLLGGGVVWGLLSMFSKVRSGFLVPILISGAVTLGLVLGAGMLAAAVLIAGFLGATFLGGWYMFGFRPPWQKGEGTREGTTIWWGAATAAFVVWAGGAVIASLAGPLAAASAFMRGGTSEAKPAPQAATTN